MEGASSVVSAVTAMALQLLDLAGASREQAHCLFVVSLGGSADIIGMLVSEEQLQVWHTLGGQGERAFNALSRHANDCLRAFGSYYYDLETLKTVLSEVKGDHLASICECTLAYMVAQD